MIRIAMVEDDAFCRQQLSEYLRRYERESGQNFHISVFQDGAEIARDYKPVYDIILMDIEMYYMDGMTAAERIRKLDMEAVIIFITNMPQYVMKGYTVDAMDYVLKPISYYAFSQRIDRALARMKKRSRSYISIPFKGGVKKQDVSQIVYVEVQDHALRYHTTGEDFDSRGTLSELEKELSPVQFFRCSKYCLVNLEYVEAVQGSDIVLGSDTLQVSRARKKPLMDALNNYINEVSK